MTPHEPARYHSTSPEETFALGERLGQGLVDGTAEGVVVLLEGPLGAGKTVLAKGIARGLGVREEVISPTYTIISDYAIPGAPDGARLSHVDLYRIEGSDQLENLGLDDILRGTGAVLGEWGEKIEPRFEGARWRVSIAIASDGGRDIVVEERAP